MTMEEPAGIKIRRLRIKDYKGIDELELNFPRPTMLDDPDIMVMGSKNGVGKTSVLECCVLLLQVLAYPIIKNSEFISISKSLIDATDLMVRAGADNAKIEGQIDIEGDSIILDIEIPKSGNIIKVNKPPRINLQKYFNTNRIDALDKFVSVVSDADPNPILSTHLLYFHSFRKVLEGNPKLGKMLKKDDSSHFPSLSSEDTTSIFKLQIIRSLMSKAELFETPENEQAEDTLLKLNELVERYANGRIEKLRQSENNAVEIRINPVDGCAVLQNIFRGCCSGT